MHERSTRPVLGKCTCIKLAVAIRTLRARRGRFCTFMIANAVFSNRPARAVMPTLDQSIPVEQPGTQIGPYKLLEQIGEGGMGVVYVASQREPIRRNVALKIIKPGMDTREVVARFEAERQALALMDHPNIAKVFDARCDRRGTTLLRDGVGQRDADHRVLRSRSNSRPASGWSCSSPSATACSTRIRKA